MRRRYYSPYARRPRGPSTSAIFLCVATILSVAAFVGLKSAQSQRHEPHGCPSCSHGAVSTPADHSGSRQVTWDSDQAAVRESRGDVKALARVRLMTRKAWLLYRKLQGKDEGQQELFTAHELLQRARDELELLPRSREVSKLMAEVTQKIVDVSKALPLHS